MRNKSYTVLAGFALAVTLFLLAAPATLTAQECNPNSQISLVSVSSDGTQGNWDSGESQISSDGRYIIFSSQATNLVPGESSTLFLRDRLTCQTTSIPIKGYDDLKPNNDLHLVDMSADARFLVFYSYATNLVPDDTNTTYDVFVYDRIADSTTRVSVASDGTQSNGDSQFAAISADSRYVVFDSNASNLVEGDSNNVWDIFVHDMQTGQTTRVSTSSSDIEGNEGAYEPTISGDGRYIAFTSSATNLVPGYTNLCTTFDDLPVSCSHIFLHDRIDHETIRISVSSTGALGNDVSEDPDISADGRYIAYTSFASNLVPADNNNVCLNNRNRVVNCPDVFVYDRLTHQTSLVSINSNRLIGNEVSYYPSISGDGRFVAFDSLAANLAPGDTNSKSDVFLHDRLTKQTERLSVGVDGGQMNIECHYYHDISDNGRYVTFRSCADTLVPGDNNRVGDVFVAGAGPIDPATAFPHRNYTTGDITVTWNPITWATRYRIQVDTDTAFDNPFINEPTDKLEKPLSGLETGIYYWRVQAIRANGSAGGWSAVESFTVGWE